MSRPILKPRETSIMKGKNTHRKSTEIFFSLQRRIEYRYAICLLGRFSNIRALNGFEAANSNLLNAIAVIMSQPQSRVNKAQLRALLWPTRAQMSGGDNVFTASKCSSTGRVIWLLHHLLLVCGNSANTAARQKQITHS